MEKSMKYIIYTLGCKVNQYETQAIETLLNEHGHTAASEGESADALGLDGHEVFDIAPVDFSQGLPSPSYARITALRQDGSTVEFEAEVRVDTPTEGAYFSAGGILPFVLDTLMA